MELYLDSADITEIKEAFQLGFLTGLTTTPTFMHRHGIKDIDKTILELSKLVPILQIEALGKNSQEIVDEAFRQNDLGLDKTKTVYKIPVSIEGLKACKILINNGFLVNVHLIYTLQQAYIAMEAGATYVCPLIGRLQDEGTDALSMMGQIVEAVDYYNYNSKVMFSSVRNVEHVRNALNSGVHCITAPWKIIKQLTENHFTRIGTEQFEEHTRLMKFTVGEVTKEKNPTVTLNDSISDSLIKMTSAGYGSVTVIDGSHKPIGFFTDGDFRRLIQNKSNIDISKFKLSDLELNKPKMVDAKALLYEAQKLFVTHKVNQLVVTSDDKAIGILDIQDLIENTN